MSYPVEKIMSVLEPNIQWASSRTMKLLEEFSKIDCGTKDIDGNSKVISILDGLFSEFENIQVEHCLFEGYGSNIIAKVNPGNPNGKILINGHLDTVFERGDTAAHPFRIEGDRAYGLGIVDCKAGVVVSILSTLIMQKAGLLPDKEILFLFGCDEEVGSPVSTEFYKKHAKGADMAFVFEPGRDGNGILTSRKGVRHYLIECTGKRAHAGNNYQDGRSAVAELADKILWLYAQNDHEKKVEYNIAALQDGGLSMGVVPDYASCKVEVRVKDENEITQVEDTMHALMSHTFIDGCKTNVTCVKKLDPMARTSGNLALYQKIAAVGKELGMDLPEQTSGGWGDACTFSFMGIPAVDAMGPYMYNIHSFDESMRISSVEERIKLFCAVLGNI